MRVNCIGGGPGGLYFAILAKKHDPSSEVAVYERNQADDTFGFGVVFSDATLEGLEQADAESYRAIIDAFYHWDEIDIFHGPHHHRSTGHGFSGLSRQTLLTILQKRARELGVALHFDNEVESLAEVDNADLVVIADGVNSRFRTERADVFKPDLDWRPNRFVWLGTTFPYEAFTFYFKETEWGLFQIHAYRYEDDKSTFIVECSDETFQRTGLSVEDEDGTVEFIAKIFADELAGHPLLKNRSVWRQFPTVRNGSWSDDQRVLLGDAAHTAHFSIGSGTKLALEDAIELATCLSDGSVNWRSPSRKEVTTALKRYEEHRRPTCASLQRAAQVSLEWFETTDRALKHEPIEFAFSLLTRSLRVSHDNLKLRDPAFVAEVDAHVARRAREQAGIDATTEPTPPPMFTPYRVRALTLSNRIVVSPMCMYSATDGTVGDFHLVHLGARAQGGAGLVLSEMTDVSAEARITPGCAGLYKDEHVAAWRRITAFVHQHSGAHIGVQLGHAGRKGATKLMWEGIDRPLPREQAWPLISASPIPYFPESQVPKEMDEQDMTTVLADFVAATKRAIDADFDWLELHMAHGYLLASFLSPLTNRRKDGFGGSVQNRLRFPLRVFDAVRAAWPESRPMSVRLSASDWKPDGISPEDVIEIARTLKEHGCDMIDVSSGQTVSDARPEYGRLYQVPFSDLIRNEAAIPTMAVGNISSFTDANSVVAARRADLCVLARAHLFDPYWTHHAATEQDHELPWPDQYPLRGYRPRLK